MIKKFIIFLLLSCSYLFGRGCNIANENNGYTCAVVFSTLQTALTSYNKTFREIRQSKIEIPTRELSDLMEKYNKINAYYYALSDVNFALKNYAIFSQKEINHYSQQEFALKELKSSVENLSNSIDILLLEMEKSQNEFRKK